MSAGQMRTCVRCGHTLPLTSFSIHWRSHDPEARRDACQSCLAADRRAWYRRLDDAAYRQLIARNTRSRSRRRAEARHERMAMATAMLERMERMRLSDREIARLAGCKVETLHRIRHGELVRGVSEPTLRRLSDAYVRCLAQRD